MSRLRARVEVTLSTSALRGAAAFAILGGASFASSPARADEPFPGRAERILSPGRSVVAEDSAEALVLNPANLGRLPGAELR